MAVIIGKIKCYFCGEPKGFMHSVHEYGIYASDYLGKRIFYHPECLEMVEAEPEKFGHLMMDKALHIDGLKQRNNNRTNSSITKVFKEKVEKLNRAHFEKMMPKQY